MRITIILLHCLAMLIPATAMAAASELKDRESIRNTVIGLFNRSDFQSIEKISNEYLVLRSRTSSGVWKISIVNNAMQTAMANMIDQSQNESIFHELERKVEQWQKLYPKSSSAIIAASQVNIAHAGIYPNISNGSFISQGLNQRYKKYIALARSILERNKGIAARDPRWFETMFTIARAEKWNQQRFDALLDEGAKNEPQFYQSYFEAAKYMMPRGGGSLEKIEEFAQKAMRITAKQEGAGMYARIYWYVSEVEDGNNLFKRTLAQWPLMKKGFEDILSRYPDGWNLNNYAKFSCIAFDRVTATELLEKVRANFVEEVWRPQSLIFRCTQWTNRPDGSPA